MKNSTARKNDVCISMTPEYHRKYNRDWRKRNQEKVRAYNKKYYMAHHPQAGKKTWKYTTVGTEDMALYRKEYKKNRKKMDGMYAFEEHIREMIRQSFRRRSCFKSNSTESILGCTIGELNVHLRKTWMERYGFEYNGEPSHIDHIIPLSTAKTKEEIAKLCHYTNLQLLTPEDNIKKGAKM